MPMDRGNKADGDEGMAAACPRCGRRLRHGFTLSRKVCADCEDCGGRLVTLPVLKEGLGAQGVSMLFRALRDAPKAGCHCPTCGNDMGILRVEIDGRKIEIDVCDKCLSVWCDSGEFETLVPAAEPAPREQTFGDVAGRASPEARERLAKAMLEAIPDDIGVGDVTLGDIVGDIVRLIAGAPTRWRRIAPVTPILSLLTTIAIPVAHSCAYFAWHEEDIWKGARHYRRFWIADNAMVNASAFRIGDPFPSMFTFMFTQPDLIFSIVLALLMFPVFATVERRTGVARFLVLFGSLWIATLAGHALQSMLFPAAEGRLCGIAPIAFGFAAFVRTAYPEASWSDQRHCWRYRFPWFIGTLRDTRRKPAVIAGFHIVTLAMVLIAELIFLATEQRVSVAPLAIAASIAVGIFQGRSQRSQDGDIWKSP